MCLVGGRGTVWGAVLGAFIVQPLSVYLIYLIPTEVAGQVHLVALGIVLVLVVMFLPDGIIPTWQSWRLRRARASQGPGEPAAGAAS